MAKKFDIPEVVPEKPKKKKSVVEEALDASAKWSRQIDPAFERAMRQDRYRGCDCPACSSQSPRGSTIYVDIRYNGYRLDELRGTGIMNRRVYSRDTPYGEIIRDLCNVLSDMQNKARREGFARPGEQVDFEVYVDGRRNTVNDIRSLERAVIDSLRDHRMSPPPMDMKFF